MFMEQVKWAEEAGVDFIIAETFGFLSEARLVLKTIKTNTNLPGVLTIVIHQDGLTRDGSHQKKLVSHCRFF